MGGGLTQGFVRRSGLHPCAILAFSLPGKWKDLAAGVGIVVSEDPKAGLGRPDFWADLRCPPAHRKKPDERGTASQGSWAFFRDGERATSH